MLETDNPSPIYPSLSPIASSHLDLVTELIQYRLHWFPYLKFFFSPLQFLLCFAAKLNFLRGNSDSTIPVFAVSHGVPTAWDVGNNSFILALKAFCLIQPTFSVALALLYPMGVNTDYSVYCFPVLLFLVYNILQLWMHSSSLCMLKQPLHGPAQLFQWLWSPGWTSSLSFVFSPSFKSPALYPHAQYHVYISCFVLVKLCLISITCVYNLMHLR